MTIAAYMTRYQALQRLLPGFSHRDSNLRIYIAQPSLNWAPLHDRVPVPRWTTFYVRGRNLPKHWTLADIQFRVRPHLIYAAGLHGPVLTRFQPYTAPTTDDGLTGLERRAQRQQRWLDDQPGYDQLQVRVTDWDAALDHQELTDRYERSAAWLATPVWSDQLQCWIAEGAQEPSLLYTSDQPKRTKHHDERYIALLDLYLSICQQFEQDQLDITASDLHEWAALHNASV